MILLIVAMLLFAASMVCAVWTDGAPAALVLDVAVMVICCWILSH